MSFRPKSPDTHESAAGLKSLTSILRVPRPTETNKSTVHDVAKHYKDLINEDIEPRWGYEHPTIPTIVYNDPA